MPRPGVEASQARAHARDVLERAVRAGRERRVVAGQRLAAVHEDAPAQRIHRIPAVELEQEALDEVARADAGGIEALHDALEHAFDVLRRRPGRLGHLLGARAEIAVLVERVHDRVRDRARALVHRLAVDLVVQAREQRGLVAPERLAVGPLAGERVAHPVPALVAALARRLLGLRRGLDALLLVELEQRVLHEGRFEERGELQRVHREDLDALPELLGERDLRTQLAARAQAHRLSPPSMGNL